MSNDLTRKFLPSQNYVRTIGGGRQAAYIKIGDLLHRLQEDAFDFETRYHVPQASLVAHSNDVHMMQTVVCELTIDGVTRSAVGAKNGKLDMADNIVKTAQANALSKACQAHKIGDEVWDDAHNKYVLELQGLIKQTIGAKGTTIDVTPAKKRLVEVATKWAENFYKVKPIKNIDWDDLIETICGNTLDIVYHDNWANDPVFLIDIIFTIEQGLAD